MAQKLNHIRRAAMTLLQRGLATPFEIATVSGMSRQLCRHWARDFTDSRAAYLERVWEKALATPPNSRNFSWEAEKKPHVRKVVEEI